MEQTDAEAGEGALFVYGTLIEQAFRERMLGRPVKTIEARLPGFERGRTRHFHVAAREGAVTEGLIIFGLSAADFAMLDEYEEVPTLYTRERTEAIDSDGRRIGCWVYMPTGWAQPRGATDT